MAVGGLTLWTGTPQRESCGHVEVTGIGEPITNFTAAQRQGSAILADFKDQFSLSSAAGAALRSQLKLRWDDFHVIIAADFQGRLQEIGSPRMTRRWSFRNVTLRNVTRRDVTF